MHEEQFRLENKWAKKLIIKTPKTTAGLDFLATSFEKRLWEWPQKKHWGKIISDPGRRAEKDSESEEAIWRFLTKQTSQEKTGNTLVKAGKMSKRWKEESPLKVWKYHSNPGNPVYRQLWQMYFLHKVIQMFQSMSEYKYEIPELTFFLHCNLSHLSLKREYNERGTYELFLWIVYYHFHLDDYDADDTS